MWALTNRERKIFRKVIPTELRTNTVVQCPNGVEASIEELCKKKRISAAEVEAMRKSLPSNVEFYKFVESLRPRRKRESSDANDEEALTEEQRRAKQAYRERIQRLKDQQANREYEEMTRTIDPTKASRPLIENFGQELRAVNRQMIAIVNTLITVGGAFAFGFWGIGFAYPHMKLDIAERMLMGLVFGTIVFFADLYFIVKGMDTDGNL